MVRLNVFATDAPIWLAIAVF